MFVTRRFLLSIAICLVFQAEIYFVNADSEDELNYEEHMGKVIFANVVYRHGDRTPIDPYPTDPYRNSSSWPVGFGQLTNVGKEQHFELGQWLRYKYDSLLTDTYSRDKIYVLSTDVDRTLMSAECNLAGMYPPKDSQIWNELQWQPIPVHTIPEKLDNVLAAKKPCPAYEEEFQRLLQTKEIQAINNSFLELYKTLNRYSGRLVTTLENIDYIYDTLWIEYVYNYTLPDWTKSIFPHPMEEASKYNFLLPTWTKKMARLKSGLLVKEMISSMKHKKENKRSHNLKIYSAHDTTLANLMNTLGVYNMINPPFTACFMMELRVSPGGHKVTLFYRNSSIGEPYLLTVPGCSPICPLDKFISLLEPVTIDDWDSECQVSFFTSYSNLIVIALVVLIILVVVLLASGIIYFQKRRRSTHWYRKLKTDNL